MASYDYDLVIVGGGPAGASAANGYKNRYAVELVLRKVFNRGFDFRA